MDLGAFITTFGTGTYSVTRKERSSMVRGRAVDGTTTTVSITASVSPASGEDMNRLPQGRQSSAVKVIFTRTRLYTGATAGTYEADVVSISGGSWEVQHVEPWDDPAGGGTMYRCLAADMS